jgi:hypothetical protein
LVADQAHQQAAVDADGAKQRAHQMVTATWHASRL